MVAGFNVDDRRRFGALAADAIWEDEVEVVGDFSIPAGVRLVIEPGTAVRFGPDSTSGGQDPQRAGLTVVGELSVGAIGSRSVRFASAAAEPQPGDWLGIFLHPRGSVDLHNVVIEHAVYGLASRGVRLPQRLQQVQVHGVAGFGVDLQGVTGTVDLDGVEVVAADSGGVRLSGPGVVRMRDVRIVASGGSGIERTGGRLELSDSELLDNGVTKETAANLVLGAGTQGLVSGNGFRGGIGIWCSGSGAVLLQDNLLTGHRLGLVSSDARPQVAGNRFVDNELALLIEGDTVPQRLQLNVVEGSGQLVESRSTVEVSAANNWWGGVDEDEIESRITGNVRFRPVLGYNPRQPLRFALAQNHPNPFNGSTRIDYSIAITDALLAGDGEVRMSVYTVAGGHVRQLVRRPLEAGAFTVVWDGRDASGRRVASGVYLYRLTTGLRREARKLVLVR
jgi:hypothetical protein